MNVSPNSTSPTVASTAIVTGAASGIGRATVVQLLGEGWNVVGADLNADSLDALVTDMEHAGHAGRVSVVRTDVSAESDVIALIEHARSTHGRVDALINAAGIGGAFGRITEISVEDWDRSFAVLTRSVFLTCKHSAELMREQGGGSIVNVASLAALTGDSGLQAYSAAKAAVLQLGRVLATELGPDRIRVNTVAPGAIATPLNRAASERFEGSNLEASQPWPEVGRAENVAEAIVFCFRTFRVHHGSVCHRRRWPSGGRTAHRNFLGNQPPNKRRPRVQRGLNRNPIPRGRLECVGSQGSEKAIPRRSRGSAAGRIWMTLAKPTHPSPQDWNDSDDRIA